MMGLTASLLPGSRVNPPSPLISASGECNGYLLQIMNHHDVMLRLAIGLCLLLLLQFVPGTLYLMREAPRRGLEKCLGQLSGGRWVILQKHPWLGWRILYPAGYWFTTDMTQAPDRVFQTREEAAKALTFVQGTLGE
jgi:hypothetical protein